MPELPRTVEAFVTQYLPAVFEAARAGRGVGTYHGHCVVRSLDAAWTLEVVDRELRVSSGARPGAIGQLTLETADFRGLLGLVAAALERNASVNDREPFTLTERSAEELRGLPGSVALLVGEGAERHAVHAVFGDASRTLEEATCRVRLSRENLDAILSGSVHPLQLLFRGEMEISGDTSLPTLLGMALLAPEE